MWTIARRELSISTSIMRPSGKDQKLATIYKQTPMKMKRLKRRYQFQRMRLEVKRTRLLKLLALVTNFHLLGLHFFDFVLNFNPLYHVTSEQEVEKGFE